MPRKSPELAALHTWRYFELRTKQATGVRLVKQAGRPQAFPQSHLNHVAAAAVSDETPLPPPMPPRRCYPGNMPGDESMEHTARRG